MALFAAAPVFALAVQSNSLRLGFAAVLVLIYVYAALNRVNRGHRRLSRAVYTDDLTGLGNKRALRKHRARLDDDPDIRWIALDADVFKRLNDVCGEHEGDLALEHFARVIRRVCVDFRVDVPVFRHGGDEYGVAAPIAIAEKLLSAIEVASPYTNGQITTKLSGAVGNTYAEASSLLKAIKEARRQVDPSLRREAR